MTVSNSIYNPISLEVGNLLKDVQTGKIGLPDLQRPFVWGNDKVRDLLDSMLRGYPIGYVMLWDSPSDDAGKKSAIGSNQKTYAVPKSLVIDGQQRLTALLSSLYGVPVRDKNFKERTVKSPMTLLLASSRMLTLRPRRMRVSCPTCLRLLGRTTITG